MPTEKTIDHLLGWVGTTLGKYVTLSYDDRFHKRSNVLSIQAANSRFFLKIFTNKSTWAQEVFAYREWAPVFGSRSPDVVAIHDQRPYALLLSSLNGIPAEKQSLTKKDERNLWTTAGMELAQLHNLAAGSFFGPCKTDGSPAIIAITSAVEFIQREIDTELYRCIDLHAVSEREICLVHAIQSDMTVFTDEPPVPCHRDYNTANWLVDTNGILNGIIDYEFSRWDVRMADFSRFPNWEWIGRPDLMESLLEGYGRDFTDRETRQLRILRTLYALSAISWGTKHSFRGFVEEGHQALAVIARS